MPDLKLSEIAAVDALAAADRLYAVAGGQSAAITVANLFATVPGPIGVKPAVQAAWLSMDPSAVHAEALPVGMGFKIDPQVYEPGTVPDNVVHFRGVNVANVGTRIDATEIAWEERVEQRYNQGVGGPS